MRRAATQAVLWVLESRTGRLLTTGVLVLEVLGVLVAVVAGLGPFGQPDAAIYVGATRAWWHGDGLYDYRFTTGFGFTYPPFAGVVFSPLLLLPTSGAVAVLQLLALAAPLALAWLVITGLGLTGSRRLGWWTACCAAALVLYPTFRDYSSGQVDGVLAVLVATDLLVLRRTRWCGLLIGLTVAVKLTPAVFVLALAAQRRWRAATIAVVTAALATAAAWAADPATSRDFWFHRLWDTGNVGSQTAALNQSLAGFVARYADPPGGTLVGAGRVVWFVLALAVLATTLWVLARRTGDDSPVTTLALTAVTTLLIAPISWHHHWVWVAAFVPVLVQHGLTLGSRAAWALLVLLPLCSLPPWWYLGGYGESHATWTSWGNVVGSALVAWGLAFAWLSWRQRPEPPPQGGLR